MSTKPLKTGPPRKKQPKEAALVEQAGCTGCEACITVCPVDCIYIVPGSEHPTLNKVVQVELERCIGCQLCAKYCPWETIYMLPYEEAARREPEFLLERQTTAEPG